jgi:hypothetical protein
MRADLVGPAATLATSSPLEEAARLVGEVVRRCRAAGRDDLADGLLALAAELVNAPVDGPDPVPATVVARARAGRLALLLERARAALAELPGGQRKLQPRLVELQRLDRGWRRTLANQLELAALDLEDEVQAAFGELARAMEAQPPARVEEAAAQVSAAVGALVERVEACERDGVRRVVRALAADLGGGLPAGLVPVLDGIGPVLGAEPPDAGPADQQAGALRWLLMANLGHNLAGGALAQVLGLGARAGLGALAVPAGVLAGPWGLAAGAVGGALLAGRRHRLERRARHQRQARELVRRWLPEVRAELQRQLRRRRTLLRLQLEAAMEAIVAGRAAELRQAAALAAGDERAAEALGRRLDALQAALPAPAPEVAGTGDVRPPARP